MPYPNDSDLYNTIRDRVRKEVFKGQEIKGAHRSGRWAPPASALANHGIDTVHRIPLSFVRA